MDNSIVIPSIPRQIYTCAKQPLPFASKIFQQYGKKTEDNYDEFTIWDSSPPFNVPEAVKVSGILSTVQALHGHRLRHMRETEIHRINRFSTTSTVTFDNELKSEIIFLVNMWRAITRDIRELNRLGYNTVNHRIVETEDVVRGINLIMAEHKQQWIAIRIVALIEDRHALDSGGNCYMELFAERWGVKYRINN